VIDCHCHLAGPEFTDDLRDVVARARDAHLTRAMVILAAEDDEELARAPRVADAWQEVCFSIGVHPHAAARFSDDPSASATTVEQRIGEQPRTRGVGEIGLDYHYDFAPAEAQRNIFRVQIALARRLRLPIVIHSREAEEDTFAILQEEGAADVGGMFHCFTGDRAMARRALDAGFHVSLAGIVTFPKALELREVARMVPLDRLLIETDSPFLAPVPHRGKRNEPALVRRVAEEIATLRGAKISDIAEAAVQNFARLFKP
jgi:TatD DNase family protein